MSISCANCGEAAEIHTYDKTIVMDGVRVSAPIKIQVCRNCGDSVTSGEDYGDWELKVALLLAEKHPNPEACAWIQTVFREHG